MLSKKIYNVVNIKYVAIFSFFNPSCNIFKIQIFDFIQIFDTVNLYSRVSIPAHEGQLAALQFSPAGNRLLTILKGVIAKN